MEENKTLEPNALLDKLGALFEKNPPPPEEQTTWLKIKTFCASHPKLLTKGVPIAMVLYLSYPLLVAFWTWLPWIYASYAVYGMIPKGALQALWLAIQAYTAKA